MEVGHKYGYLHVIGKMLRFIRKHELSLAVYFVLCISKLSICLFLADLINNAVQSAIELNMGVLSKYALQMLIVILTGTLVSYFSTYVYGLFKSRIMLDIKEYAINHIKKLPVNFIEDNHSGDIISRLTNDLTAVQNFIGEELFPTCVQLIGMVITSIFLVSISWKLYILTFITLPPSLFIITRISKPMKAYFKEVSKSLGRANTIAQDAYNGISVIKAFNLEQFFHSKFTEPVEDGLKNNIQGLHRLKFIPVFEILLRSVPASICLMYGAFLAINKEIQPGQLLSFMYLIGNIVWPFASLPGIVTNITNALGTSERFFEIMDRPVERETGISFSDMNSSTCVAFKNVSFSYDGQRNVLSDICFDVRKGSRTALVGLSGCGKSTVLKLISGYYDNYAGIMEVFGHDIREWSLQALRSKISYVTQDTYLFPASIYENILLGRPDATEEEVIMAAKAADAHDFIMELPETYETFAGEKGIKLSGGQKQRISLARAILRNAPVLLLDEPTSALDTLSESLIQKALKTFAEDKTTIIVAHRLSTIKDVDEILVIDNNCIVERGTHDQLLSINSLYSRLYEKQLKAEDDCEVA